MQNLTKGHRKRPLLNGIRTKSYQAISILNMVIIQYHNIYQRTMFLPSLSPGAQLKFNSLNLLLCHDTYTCNTLSPLYVS